MEKKSSKRRQMATLLCSLGAIAIGGVAADAWAVYINNGAGRFCYVCEGNTSGPGFQCNENNADFTGECAEGERAICGREGVDDYDLTCSPCDPMDLHPCD